MAESQTSNDAAIPAYYGENTANGDGVSGKGRRGVVGVSDTFQGVFGYSAANAGVVGESDGFDGVFGVSNNKTAAGVSGHNETGGFGVFGDSKNGGRGVAGFSDTFQGVYGHSKTNAGVVGESDGFDGVFGVSNNKTAAGVSGHNETGGFGVFGDSKNGGRGVAGFSDTFQGVYGHSKTNAGVVGESDAFDGVFGVAHRADRAAVSGRNVNPDGSVNKSGLAGFFDGKVVVTNDISLPNADCAEQFDVAASEIVEPGSVMIVDDTGVLRQSDRAYDTRVVGVVSGAGGYKPGIVLDSHDSPKGTAPIALLGKVYCKADSSFGVIAVGDLLTSSPTLGHAMKVTDGTKALGAIIGKAIRPLSSGRGLIPILVALQ
jgi:hypothetical protein